MKKFILVILVFVVFTTTINAQKESFSHGFGVGFQLGQYQQDFGLGINMVSPYFAYNRIAVRLRGNIMWNEHLDNNFETIWTTYSNLSLGMVGVAGEIGNFLRLYGEGGTILIFPSKDFSSNSIEIGGYGLFGFEFFMYSNTNYFIEIGGVGTGAIADKVLSKPIYSNGLLLNVGFRFQF